MHCMIEIKTKSYLHNDIVIKNRFSDVKDKVAIVTGATSGIVRYWLSLPKAGAKVAIAG